MITGRKLS